MEKVYHSRVRKISPFYAVVLAFILPAMLAACTAGTELSATPGQSTTPVTPPGDPAPPSDTTPPIVSITSPTTGTSYDTANAIITLSGTATDAGGLSQIFWSNDTGGSGSQSVSGTSANASFNVALASGANVLTLSSRDTSGNTGQTLLTVNYTPVTSNSATLSWDPVSAPTLSGYRIYFGTTSGSYSQQYGQGISVGNTTTFTMLGLSNATVYYFTVTSVNTSNVESVYSAEVSKAIP